MFKILYIHGYNGSTNGSSFNLLKKHLPENCSIEAVDYDEHNAKHAKDFINDYVVKNKIDLIIGSSLGAFITLTQFGRKRIVINPCYLPSVELPKIGVAKQYADTYKEYEDLINTLTKYAPKEKEHIKGFFAENDELLGKTYIKKFTDNFSEPIMIPGGHHLSEEGAQIIMNYIKRDCL